MFFVVEWKNEYNQGGKRDPAISYLSTKMRLIFPWRWQRMFNEYGTGINWETRKRGEPVVSTIRCCDGDGVRFRKRAVLALNAIHISSERKGRGSDGGGYV
jgi:hypothetical protein